MIITLWNRADRGLSRLSRLHTALASLPVIRAGGPVHAFAAMARARATRPHTMSLSVLRVAS
jgi:hypothetical protein